LTSTSVSRDAAAVSKALQLISQPRSGYFAAWQFRVLSGLIGALDRQGKSLAQFLKGNKSADVEPLFREARQTATARTSSPADRLAAISILGGASSHPQEDLQALGQLLTPQSPAVIQ